MQMASNLEYVRARIHTTPPTYAAAPVAPLLPIGTRVLVQRLVVKPEHNGKRDACCRSTRVPAGMPFRWRMGRSCH
jgi:hypothetical protein